MAGRNAKPVDLILAEGNKRHLTKAEIEERKSSEIKVGDTKLRCPDYVKTDIEAFKKWKEITKIYKDKDFVSSGDIGMLGRYCKTFSEYQVLLKAYQRTSQIHYDSEKLEEAMDESDDYFSLKVRRQIKDLFAINGILKIETAINKKMDMLIKMEDRLFLNPLSKVKNVVKDKKEEVVESKWSRFGAGKNAQ